MLIRYKGYIERPRLTLLLKAFTDNYAGVWSNFHYCHSVRLSTPVVNDPPTLMYQSRNLRRPRFSRVGKTRKALPDERRFEEIWRVRLSAVTEQEQVSEPRHHAFVVVRADRETGYSTSYVHDHSSLNPG